MTEIDYDIGPRCVVVTCRQVRKPLRSRIGRRFTAKIIVTQTISDDGGIVSLNFWRHSGETATAPGRSVKAKSFGRLRRRDRGSMAVILAVMTPLLIGFGTLAINQGYYGYRKLLLQQTVGAAALAAGNYVSTYYSSGGSTSTIVTAAQTFAVANMPSAKYGTVVQSSNVVVGNWNGTTFTSLASSHGTSPNAVQVTGLNTAANGNAVALFLGSFFNKPTVDITATVTASYGTGQAFNAIVINDMSQSFSNELSNQQTVDDAIKNCVQGATGTTSKFGITLTNGHATLYQPLVLASTSNLHGKIQSLHSNSCGINCSTGSNIAAGMYSAIQQFSDPAYAKTKKNIIIVTDGVPNAGNTIYTLLDGVTCTIHCTDAQLQAGAQTQAANAKATGISVSTIYYSGESNTTPQDAATATAYLATLVTGSGLAMVAPSTAQLNAAYAGFCSTIPSSLKLTM